MRLVMGGEDEHFGYDQNTGVRTQFLHEWKEEKFVIAAVRFAVEWSVSSRQTRTDNFGDTASLPPGRHLYQSNSCRSSQYSAGNNFA